MFGFWRLFLALTVAVSHMGFALGPYHPGVMAVMGFYLLAGYISAALWQRACRQADYPTWHYWKERFWRLMPQYWGVVLVTALLLPWLPRNHFLQAPLDFSALWQNLLVFPLAYYPLTGIDHMTLIPPAWSLAVEFHYYLLVPLLGRLPLPVLRGVWAASLGIWLMSFTGLIDPELWGYRYFPGVLFIFLTGHTLCLSHLQQRYFSYESLILLAVLILMLTLYLPYNWGIGFQFEVVVGLLIALSLTILLGRLPRNPLDEWLGKPAYLLFLLHFLAFWLLQAMLLIR
ncbi:acyltransferase family protein [Thiothrix nivea]|uniref:Membrane protein n=1 Tax=Thiothrix nivea (strain ATCC 35100 / DSM 5205 / JP2) TaxID=870187 RepID=A0A656HBN8_THINJ|nr:acyltransferase [Thiothrix nivea]EIJ34258.1 membrane protein [Thiothrix nivea DSM 5205]